MSEDFTSARPKTNRPAVVQAGKSRGLYSANPRFTDEKAADICQHFMEGKTLREISRMEGMPDFQCLTQWLKSDEGFRKEMNACREVRAMIFEDDAIEAATLPCDKDDVPSARLQFDGFKWAAEVNDASRYGKKTTVEGNAAKPITFIIQTGFPEPTESQKPPKLGENGLIEKEVVSTIAKELPATLAVEDEAEVNL